MQQTHNISKQEKSANFRRQRLIVTMLPILTFVTLSCALSNVFSSSDPNEAKIRNQLPTLTATFVSNLTPDAETGPNSEASTDPALATVLPTRARPNTATPSFIPTRWPTPTAMPTPTVTQTPTPDDFAFTAIAASSTGETGGHWELNDVQILQAEDDPNLRLYGNLANNTNSAQEIRFITGTFFNAQGEVIADENSVVDFWPSDIIPPGESMPFEMIIEDVQAVENYELRVEARPSEEVLIQNFEFLNYSQQDDDLFSCVNGTLQNPSSGLQNYLLIVAVLYDDKGQVVNFGDYHESDPSHLSGNQTLDFEICIDRLGYEISHVDLQAWGQ